MKKFLLLALALLLIPLLNSCGTIYGAAVDERNVSTIKSDHEIKARILKQFADDKDVGVLDFAVSSYEGHVYLIGEYETQTQKNRAVQIAEKQPGVKGLTTHLIKEDPYSPCGPAKNLELTAKVKTKLIKDDDIWSTNIDVKTMQCRTVLWGLVGSKKEVTKAIAHASGVKGVKSVKSLIKVK